jgi:ABC-type transporter Mla subunit MlaD
MTPANRGRAVRLVLAIDPAAWPLPRGTRFVLRWGGTASFFNRYMEMVRGPAGAPAIPNGTTVSSSAFSPTVELDTLTSLFTPAVRHATASLIRRGGTAFAVAKGPLRNALQSAPPAVAQASMVLRDLQSSNADLDQLLRSTSEVVNAVQSADPGVGQLVSGAGATLAAVAAKDGQLYTAIGRIPAALTRTESTLHDANGTLNAADLLLRRLAPGITDVRAIAHPLNDVLGTVAQVGPAVSETLDTAYHATPKLNPLLTLATKLMPQIGSIGGQATTALQCIRPYAPDIAAFANNWGDFLSWGDGKDRVIRATVQNIIAAPGNGLPYNSATATRLFPGLTYSFPRPPGEAAGEPWYLPQCGITPASGIPADDPESVSGP